MADQSRISSWLDAMEMRLRRVEELVGRPEQPPIVGLIQQILALQEIVGNLNMTVKEELPKFIEKGLGAVSDEVSCSTDAVDLNFGDLEDRLKSAKELENFLWDMEMYFQAARVSDAEKVSITSMYLIGDAKLWWRSDLSDDASANREHIMT
ncbi:hypothetical protein Sango_0256400 [Sesamum angolense]|uniref:Uncharacterized protein n=1 Tax=Sesamum angolense TaxID=2727404 RepID=A0AAE1XHG0_9LAMI|nr:hypothetical protein Sango_0256400 [Sesamum angolense]